MESCSWVRFGGGSDDLPEKSIWRRNPKVHKGTKGWSHVPWVRFGGGWTIYREKVLGDETLTSTMGQKGGVMFIIESLICFTKVEQNFENPNLEFLPQKWSKTLKTRIRNLLHKIGAKLKNLES